MNGMAQQLNWAHSTGSPLIDASNTVYTDNAGDVYIAGKFSGTNIDFDRSNLWDLKSPASRLR